MVKPPFDRHVESRRSELPIAEEVAVGGFAICRIATTGCEIRDPDGIVIAWAADAARATLIAGLLNKVELEGLGYLFGIVDEGDAATRKTKLGH